MNHCKSKHPDCPCNRCTKGWHSRRHETRDAQDAAREAYAHRAQDRPRQRWNPMLVDALTGLTVGGWEKVA